MRPKALISAEAKNSKLLYQITFNSLNDIQHKRWPSDKANREKYAINYCMSFKELKVF